MDKINIYYQNHKSFEINSFNDGIEYNVWIKIRLKRCEVHNCCNKNLSYLIFAFSILFCVSLLFFRNYEKTQYFLDLFSEGKIYYKSEKLLNLNELKMKVKNYEKLKINFDTIEDFIKRKKPKISLIMTVYNQEYFVKYIYSSIQKQTLKDIEIIIIDDASVDNSSKIINFLMKKDNRITYIRHKINKGAFYSRNEGVLFSRGEYVLIIDPDDLLLNDILIKAYEIAKYYNFDILQYYVIRGSYDKNKIWKRNKYKSGILYNKNVKDVFFYSVSRTLWDKLIKREIFIKGIFFMKKEFIHERYFVHSDDTVFWGIINSANSYGFLEQIGYFYNFENLNSLVHHYFDIELINVIFHSLFATLKYYYFQTEDNEIEKNFVGYKFFNEKVFRFYTNMTIYLTKGFNYIIDVLNMYINCSFFNTTQKLNLNHFRNLIIKRKIKLRKK